MYHLSRALICTRAWRERTPYLPKSRPRGPEEQYHIDSRAENESISDRADIGSEKGEDDTD